MHKKLQALFIAALVAFSTVSPPPLTQHASAATETYTLVGISGKGDEAHAGNRLSDFVLLGYNPDTGRCAGSVNSCYYQNFELVRWVWREGGAGGNGWSKSWHHWELTYECPVCGHTETTDTKDLDPGESVAVEIHLPYSRFSKLHNHSIPKTIPDRVRKNFRLCTDNLTTEYHDESHHITTYHRIVCSCGDLIDSNAAFPTCRECNWTFEHGVSNDTCGHSAPDVYRPHNSTRIGYCATHKTRALHYYYGNAVYVSTKGYSNTNYLPAMWIAIQRTCSVEGYECPYCGDFARGNHTSLQFITQEEQIISATLSSSSVGYGSVSPTLTVSGCHTTLSYSSSNTGVATISSTGVITLCGCGDTTFTVTAAETDNWTSAKATAVLKVVKGNLSIKTIPTASAVNYGQTLQSSSLSSGVAQNASGNSVGGIFSWKTPSTYPENAKVYIAKFAPTETALYNY